MTMKNNIISAIAGALAATVLLGLLFKSSSEVEKIIEIERDTVLQIVFDTTIVTEPLLITNIQLDTVFEYITNTDTIYLPRMQRNYRDSSYSAWVSGVDPVLDSIRIFNKIQYKTITNNTHTTEYRVPTRLYLSGGMLNYEGLYYPQIGVDLATPKGWIFGAQVSYVDSKPIYSGKIGYNIWK